MTVHKEDRRIQVCVSHPGAPEQHVRMEVLLPPTYPVSGPPLLELHARHVPEDVLAWATRELEASFVPGDVCLYNWVEWLKDTEALWSARPPAAAGGGHGAVGDDGDGEVEGDAEPPRERDPCRRAAKGAAAPAAREQDVQELLRTLGVTSGDPYMEKRSTFQAHVAPVSNFEQVQAVMDALLALNKVRSATHNIMAYRIVPPGGGVVHQDYDDDGETAAGGRMLHLLQVADVRNVVVVVSRWFGGVLLGPSRFTAINNTARELLERLGHMGPRKPPPPQQQQGGGSSSSSSKRGAPHR